MEETSMSWFDILKNLKGKGKSKGSTLDTDRIKINIQDDECKKKILEIRNSPLSIPSGSLFFAEDLFNRMSEEVACEFLKHLRDIDDDIMNMNPIELRNKYNRVVRKEFMGHVFIYDVFINENEISHTDAVVGHCLVKMTEDLAFDYYTVGSLPEIFAIGFEVRQKAIKSQFYDGYQKWRKLL